MVYPSISRVMELSNQFLLDHNIIDLCGEINDQLAQLVIAQIQYLDYKFIKENVDPNDRIITIQINSPGGSVSAGLAIYDCINNAKAKIATIAVGLAASMGAFLLSSGSKGLRQALPNSRILIHQPLGQLMGQTTDIIAGANWMQKTKTQLAQILALNTNQPLDKILTDTERDLILTAKDAVDYGLIDFIVPVKIKAIGE